MKTFAWLHCNTDYRVGDKIRIYNSIVIPNDNIENNGGSNCYPMILCTQIWQPSPANKVLVE